MGSFILRGITTALLVTVLTLFAGIVWNIMDLGGLSLSLLLDIGLFASCLVGGYRTARESGEWLLGGIVGAGYVAVGTLLLALFLPIRGWGFLQVLAEGVIIGLVAGAIGAGGSKGVGASAWSGNRSKFTPSYAGYETNDQVNSQFDWDKEEDLEEWKDMPISNWIESSKGDLRGTHGSKRGNEKNPEVQWPWDQEEEKVIDSGSGRGPGPGHTKPLLDWEPDPVKTGKSGRNRASLDNISENRGSRPWWE